MMSLLGRGNKAIVFNPDNLDGVHMKARNGQDSVDRSSSSQPNSKLDTAKTYVKNDTTRKPSYKNLGEVLMALDLDSKDFLKVRNSIDEWFKQYPEAKIMSLKSVQEQERAKPLLSYLHELLAAHFTEDDTQDFIQITLRKILNIHLDYARRRRVQRMSGIIKTDENSESSLSEYGCPPKACLWNTVCAMRSLRQLNQGHD